MTQQCVFCNRFATITPETEYREAIINYDNDILSFIAPKYWPNNKGSVLIIPRPHHKDIYTTPDDLIVKIALETKRLAVAMRRVFASCLGTTIRNHNEYAGNQTVFHYHVHVTPRYTNDKFFQLIDATTMDFSPEWRVPFANILRNELHLPRLTPLANDTNVP
jgi:histidine triad (HIT) family protein